MTELNENVKLSVIEGIGKASGKPYRALKIEIGQYETLVFPKPIELDHIESILEQE